MKVYSFSIQFRYVDVPFVRGCYLHGKFAFYRLFSHYIQYDNRMPFIPFIFIFIVSTQFANILFPHINQLPADVQDDNPLVICNEEDIEFLDDKSWSSIMVNEELFNNIEGKLSFIDFPHVQYIYIQDRSFFQISEIVISNLSELKAFNVDFYSFSETRSICLSSISICLYSIH